MTIVGNLKRIKSQLEMLTAFQLDSIDRIIQQLQRQKEFSRNLESDLITQEILEDFGDALRIHHVFSGEALSKDRFEFALERVLRGRNIDACRAKRGNPGHDITINNSRVSLKTQADKNIRRDRVHISKYMELGKGQWTDQVDDLSGLLHRFFAHLSRYDRIFTLRRLKDSTHEHYELVEIPKNVLERSKTGDMRIVENSTQQPKPGYCTVTDELGVEFQLYFDGGTERKLQVKNLRKSLCVVRATWRFPRQEADKTLIPDDELDL